MFKQSNSFADLVDAAFSQRSFDAPQPDVPSVNISEPDKASKVARAQTDEQAEQTSDLDPVETATHCVETSAGKFWFRGNSLLCACPDCAAPMTVRTWIGLADCWRCDCSMQLSQEQLDEIYVAVASDEQPQPAPRPQLPTLAPRDRQSPNSALDWELRPDSIDSSFDDSQQELEQLTAGSATAQLLRRAFTMTPAWLISFLVHLILILILTLFVLQQTQLLEESIILSTFTDTERKEGGKIRIDDLERELVDDLRDANDMEMSDEEIRNVVEEAKNDAQELLAEIAPQENIDKVKKNITTQRGPLNSFAARDPRVRNEIVKKEGGTTLTEAAVARGLRWLASVQNDDGSWSLGQYDRSNVKSNRGDAAATSLALLPFLGAGQTHESGIYRENVAKGLSWMISRQKPDGDLRAGSDANWGLYAHGQATIVLSEAFALTGDQSLAEPTQLAIEFIQEAQHKQGGWRYRPKQVGDTSVFGWQVMALQSAKAPNIGIEVDEDVLKLADYYLDQAATSKKWLDKKDLAISVGTLYNYKAGQDNPTKTMTAEAILCRMYLGWKRDDPRVISAVNWLIKNHMPREDKANLYYWYYGTQVMHHFGGEPWRKWNQKMRKLLVESQSKKGKHAGSWEPKDFKWGRQGERIYVTSLAVCTLEVYYRHLPLFKPIEFE